MVTFSMYVSALWLSIFYQKQTILLWHNYWTQQLKSLLKEKEYTIHSNQVAQRCLQPYHQRYTLTENFPYYITVHCWHYIYVSMSRLLYFVSCHFSPTFQKNIHNSVKVWSYYLTKHIVISPMDWLFLYGMVTHHFYKSGMLEESFFVGVSVEPSRTVHCGCTDEANPTKILGWEMTIP